MKRRFELRHLESFLAVMEERHFGRAAQRLCLSQPALSRNIQQLEVALGIRVFERHSRKVVLSPAGEVLVGEARAVQESVSRLQNRVRFALDGRAGRLTVAYIDFALGGILPDVLQRYRQNFPEVEIQLVRVATDVQREGLLSGDLDVGFLLGQFKAPSIASVVVERQRYVALLPNRHQLAHKTTIAVTTLLQEPLVLGSLPEWSAFRRQILEGAAKRGIRPHIVQETSTSEGIFALVAAGVGASIYAQSHLDVVRNGVAVRNLTGISGDVDLHMAWNTARLGSIGKRFVREVIDISQTAQDCEVVRVGV
jgi:DNA-binding transcriptional LysR family regulator